MKTILVTATLIIVAFLFSGCDDLLADPPKPKEKTQVEVTAVDENIIIRGRQHTVNLLCKDGLEYIILSQVKTLAITPHWVAENGTQQIKTCK